MKQIFKLSFLFGLLVMLLSNGFETKAQNSASCSFNLSGDPNPHVVTATVPSSTLSGMAFNLTLTLPGLGGNYGSNNYTVVITAHNPNLEFVTSAFTTFTNTFPTYTSAPINCASGPSFAVVFKFKPGITCDEDEGLFNVKVNMTGQTNPICSLNIKTTANAHNYWKVSKQHIFGNLIGQPMEWKITLHNYNPNPYGIGDYNIALGSTITDEVSSSDILGVFDGNHNPIPFSVLAPNKVMWNTGSIPSTAAHREYYVQTQCTDPNATKVVNCVKPVLRLGRPKPICTSNVLVKKICDTVAVTSHCNCSATIIKSRIYNPAVYNYTTDCEGEYKICFNNSGNIPIENINLTDIFPSGIKVIRVSVSSIGGVNMNYTLNLSGATYSGNVNSTQYFPSSNSSFFPSPADMTFNTTSGNLTTSIICLRVRFLITAPIGTFIKNCATLSFNGIDDTPGGPIEECDEFTVEEKKALPGIRKCITNNQQSFSIGDQIPFRIVITNHGAAPLSGTLMDLLGPSQQNLEIVTGTVKYSYGVAPFYGYTPCSVPAELPPLNQAYPGLWLTPDITLQNPSWVITNMPGECRFDYAYYLVIEFEAKVLPNLYGQYTNTTTLTGQTSHSAIASYNIHDYANIQMLKRVSKQLGGPYSTHAYYVQPGDTYQYYMKAENVGSHPFDLIEIEDADLDFCGNITGIVDVNSPQPVAITWTGNKLIFSPPPQLQPGEFVDFKVNMVRTNNCNTGNMCFNRAKAKGKVNYGTWNDEITDEDGPVCVHPADK